jgi:hypothetical protein
MRYAELFEAPIGDIAKIDTDKPRGRSWGTFDDIDRRLINHPKMDAKLRTLFEKAPVKIDLVFIQNKPSEFSGLGDKIKSFLRKNGVTVDPNAITIVLTENDAGDGRIPMTPWIIGHRLCHAILDSFDEEKHALEQRAANIVKSYLGYDSLGGYHSKIWDELGTFGAARDGKVRGINEFVVESMVQYLSRGKITYNVVEPLNELRTRKLEADLATFYKGILQDNVGKVFTY